MLSAQAFCAPVDFEAIETAVRSSVLNLGAALVAAYLNADRNDDQGPELRCECGGMAHYSGRRTKTFTTVVGALALHRAYYHCRECNSGFYPKDIQLGLDESVISPGVVRMIGLTAAHTSFACAQELLRELAHVNTSVKQVERSAEGLGEQIAADEQARVDVEPSSAATMYLGMDGTEVPMRASETAGRCGKQPDGSAKTREMKIVAVWTAETLNDKGRPQTDPMSTSYNAAIETARTADCDKVLSPFAQRVEREAVRRGFYDANRQMVIADGALWIWNICSEIFPDAIQIVDIFHAREKLWDVAKAVYGPGSDLAKQWAEKHLEQLKAGDIEALLEALSAFSPTHEAAVQAAGYFDKNRERMRYGQFRDQKLCVSSAVVEAGCKNAIGARLKRGGMHWSVKGVNAIAALRCSVLSNRFDDFWYAKAINQ